MDWSSKQIMPQFFSYDADDESSKPSSSETDDTARNDNTGDQTQLLLKQTKARNCYTMDDEAYTSQDEKDAWIKRPPVFTKSGGTADNDAINDKSASEESSSSSGFSFEDSDDYSSSDVLHTVKGHEITRARLYTIQTGDTIRFKNPMPMPGFPDWYESNVIGVHPESGPVLDSIGFGSGPLMDELHGGWTLLKTVMENGDVVELPGRWWGAPSDFTLVPGGHQDNDHVVRQQREMNRDRLRDMHEIANKVANETMQEFFGNNHSSSDSGPALQPQEDEQKRGSSLNDPIIID